MKPEKVDRVSNKRRGREETVKTDQSGSELVPRNVNDNFQQQYYERSWNPPEPIEVFEPLEPSPNWRRGKPRSRVDISQLAAECVAEHMEPKLELNSDVVARQNRSLVVMQTRNTVIAQNPEFELTFEEEFKIHEFLVRKENVLDSIVSHLESLPRFEEKFTKFVISCNEKSNLPAPFNESPFEVPIEEHKFTATAVLQNIATGGIIRQSLEMYDEHKQIDPIIKIENFFSTIGVGVLCNW